MSRTFKIIGILSLLFIFSCSDLEKNITADGDN